jgi:hypothetical protein
LWFVFYKRMMQAVGCLSAVRVGDLVAVVAPAAGKEATVLPVAVEAALVVETEVMQEVEVSTVNATVVNDEVPVEARAKSKVPKGFRPTQASPANPPSARLYSRTATIQTAKRIGHN